MIALALVGGAIMGTEIMRIKGGYKTGMFSSSVDVESVTREVMKKLKEEGMIHGRKTAISTAAEIAEKAVVGVVAITEEQVLDTVWLPFFGLGRVIPEMRDVKNIGSGFIISQDGIILTNNHVIEGAKRILINLANGDQLEGKILGADPSSDIAVLQIDGDDFPVVAPGNSDSLQIGEWVVAIGNPFLNIFNDSRPTVTVGVVSALGRNFIDSSNTGKVYYQRMIQTDAAINPGNSGGPLCNIFGEVIGINTAIYTTNHKGSWEIENQRTGINFAISINTAKRIVQEIINFGGRRRVTTGLTIVDVNPEIRRYLQLPGEESKGVMVIAVDPEGPGQRAGIEPGDIITQLGSRLVYQSSDMEGVFLTYFPGDEVEIKIRRKGKIINKTLILDQLGPVIRNPPLQSDKK